MINAEGESMGSKQGVGNSKERRMKRAMVARKAGSGRGFTNVLSSKTQSSSSQSRFEFVRSFTAENHTSFINRELGFVYV